MSETPMSQTVDSPSPLQGSARDREIVEARVIVTCPGRNFVTLKIRTCRASPGWAMPRSTAANWRWQRTCRNTWCRT